MDAVTTFALFVTVTLAVSVHPLVKSVTVSVYAPGALTCAESSAFPDTMFPDAVLHANESEAGDEEDPSSVTDGFAQSICAGDAIFAFGAVVFSVTITLAVIEQPDALSVTVSVYVPGALTCAESFVVEERIFPPDVVQL